ncbi:MAG: thioesterase [Bacteroidales bacterium]|nr:thioesterase [Bacteroidales bacterium]
MIYQLPFTIYTLLSDRYCRIKMSAIAQLLQEVAEMHCTETGIGYHTLIKENKIWVLTRSSYRILSRYPKLDEQVTLRTWSKCCDGLFATREFEILSQMNEVLVAGTTQWVIMDIVSRKVNRLSNEFLAGYEHHDQGALTCTSPRLRMPEGMEMVSEFQVAHSSIDKAQHVNNTEYIRWTIDVLPEEVREKGIRSLDINYNLETRPEEMVQIFMLKNDEGYWFQVKNPRGVAVNILMK